jgi:hypothetical protein
VDGERGWRDEPAIEARRHDDAVLGEEVGEAGHAVGRIMSRLRSRDPGELRRGRPAFARGIRASYGGAGPPSRVPGSVWS